MNDAIRLTNDQITHYRENGYLRLNRLADDEELPILREVYDRLFEKRVGREAGDQFDLAGTDEDDQTARLPQLMNPAKYPFSMP